MWWWQLFWLNQTLVTEDALEKWTLCSVEFWWAWVCVCVCVYVITFNSLSTKTAPRPWRIQAQWCPYLLGNCNTWKAETGPSSLLPSMWVAGNGEQGVLMNCSRSSYTLMQCTSAVNVNQTLSTKCTDKVQRFWRRINLLYYSLLTVSNLFL